MVKFKQGKFHPKHSEKYIGDLNNIVYRSSYERKFAIWADTNPRILRYSSEEVKIKYISSIDGREHTYYMDFYIEYQNKDGNIEKTLIEVKPYSQTIPPVKGVNMKTYLYQVEQYAKNVSKWKATQQYCKDKGLKFRIITEKELAII